MIFIAYLFALPAVQAKKPVEAAKKPQESASYKSSTSKWTPETLTGKPTRNGLFTTPANKVQSAALRRQQGDKNIAEQMAKDATYRKERALAENQKSELAQMEIKSTEGWGVLNGKQLAAKFDSRIPADREFIAKTLEFFENGQNAIKNEAKTLKEGTFSFARHFYGREYFLRAYLMLAKLTPTQREFLFNKDSVDLLKNPSKYISKEQFDFMVRDGKMTRKQAIDHLREGYRSAVRNSAEFSNFLRADFNIPKPEAKTESK